MHKILAVCARSSVNVVVGLVDCRPARCWALTIAEQCLPQNVQGIASDSQNTILFFNSLVVDYVLLYLRVCFVVPISQKETVSN